MGLILRHSGEWVEGHNTGRLLSREAQGLCDSNLGNNNGPFSAACWGHLEIQQVLQLFQYCTDRMLTVLAPLASSVRARLTRHLFFPQ